MSDIVLVDGGPLADARNIPGLCREEGTMDALCRAWPGDLDADRRANKTAQLLEQAAIYVANQKPKVRDALCRCVGASVVDSLVTVASMGLSFPLQQVYLVPFGGACQPMVSYQGFIRLMTNTRHITHVESVLIYEGEDWEFWRDENGPHWRHKQIVAVQGDESKVRGCYSVAYTIAGSPILELMSRSDLEKVEQASKMSGAGPYKAWRSEMWRKAPIRRMEKRIQKDPDDQAAMVLARAVQVDNQMFDLDAMDQYAEASKAHSRGLRERAESAYTANEAPEMPPEADEPSAPAAPPVAATRKVPTSTGIERFRARVSERRGSTSSLSDEDWISCVCEAVTGERSLLSLDIEQFTAVGEAIAAGKFDWDTGDAVPNGSAATPE